MTLLSIVADAAVSLGLPEPSAVTSSTDLATKKLYRFANQAGKQLVRYHEWQALIVEQEFTTLAQEEQTNALPPVDYGRMVARPEVWDRTSNLRLFGPTPQRYWQLMKSGFASGTPGYWRILGNQMHIFPALEAGHELAFEYVSKRWVNSASGDPQEEFMADTDVSLLSEEILTLEIIWRFRQSRGFAQYAEDLATCEREKEKIAAADRALGRIRTERNDVAAWPQAPYWNGTVGA